LSLTDTSFAFLVQLIGTPINKLYALLETPHLQSWYTKDLCNNRYCSSAPSPLILSLLFMTTMLYL